MSSCVDKSLGKLLHNYELGLLSEEDKKQLELHLFECDYCRGLAGEFLDLSRMLRYDPDAQAILEEISVETDTGKENGPKKLPLISRLLLAAAAVLMLAIPVYKYVLQNGSPSISQTVILFPTRSSANAIIDIDKGGTVEFKFHVSEGFDASVNLTLVRVGGDTVETQADYSDFDENGTGSLTLPVSTFSEGHYSLIIEPTVDSIGAERLQYLFRAN